MERKWIKRLVWLFISPILLFLTAMILLYLPPVQNYLRGEVAAYVSKSTGLDVAIGRINLRFPLNLLVDDVKITRQSENILSLDELNVRVELLPLFRGRIDIDNATLVNAIVDSHDLLKETRLKGVVGAFFFTSKGVDLSRRLVAVNELDLSNTHLSILLNDTTSSDTTKTEPPLDWKIELGQMNLKNVSFSLQLPSDSLNTSAHFGKAKLFQAKIDLKKQAYSLKKLFLINASSMYHKIGSKPMDGFDPSHLALKNIHLELDSFNFEGRKMNASLKRLMLLERSGLSITSLTGRLHSDAHGIELSQIKLHTPHSEIDVAATANWDSLLYLSKARAQVRAYLGKEDLFLLKGQLPPSFKTAYPFRPLTIRALAEGDLNRVELSTLEITLPGAFNLSGQGRVDHVADSVSRSGFLDLKLQTQTLNFLESLWESEDGKDIAIPDSIQANARLEIEGSRLSLNLEGQERLGSLKAQADCNLNDERFNVELHVDSLSIDHFLPQDSIYELGLSASVKGRGFDVTNLKSTLEAKCTLNYLNYKTYPISDVSCHGILSGGLLKFTLDSHNSLLRMHSDGEYHLNYNYPDGKINMNVRRLNLYALGLIREPLEDDFAFNLMVEVRSKKVQAILKSGDMVAELNSPLGVQPLISQTNLWIEELLKQVDHKQLNHQLIREKLPAADVSVVVGRRNPLAHYYESRQVRFKELSLKANLNAQTGIHGKVGLYGLQIDTLQLDTIFFNLSQDSTKLQLYSGVVNASKNPQLSFRSTLTGELNSQDAQLMLNYLNGKGETGILLGVKMTPFTGKKAKHGGLLLRLLPEEPIIAFRKFHFKEKNNWLYWHYNNRIYAGIDMLSDEGMGFRAHSVLEDTLSLQNINMELTRVRLRELSKVLPYLPEVSGLFSADMHYIQTDKTLQLSAEATIDELSYERHRIGDVSLGATWLPGESGKQYLSTYLTHEGEEVMTADGSLTLNAYGKDSIAISTQFSHFPLSIADALVPNEVVKFSGDIDGELGVTGDVNRPLLNGELKLDSVSIFSRQTGAKFTFDNRPVVMKNNKMLFDRFAIYTVGENPFTIDGYVDFRQLSRPMAHFDLLAENYLLLNAKRTRESLAYGKVLVDFKSTIRGSFDDLKMRGNMNVLGSTDLTYVMTDSPLTVQDRLGSLVTFTSFNDSVPEDLKNVASVSLGGMDIAMTMHIDPSVRLRADLSADRSNRIELEGGGDLLLKYTPQGDLSLAGRYQLSGGMIKYALPVIPLKEFKINEGSYVEWSGNAMNPTLNLKATERMRASVSDTEDGPSRMVSFDVSVLIKQKLDDLFLAFDLEAPEDVSLQNQLAVMGAEERGKQAIALMVTGSYLGNGLGNSGNKGLNLNMGSALNSVLTSQINSLVGNLKNANLSFGVEEHQEAESGNRSTDYSFRYSQRFFNDRFQIVLGGKVSTGTNATNTAESFIDNVSLEYRLDGSGTRYVRLFYDKNFESLLEGEITEAGVGVVLRKKLDKLSELFIFRKKKKR